MYRTSLVLKFNFIGVQGEKFAKLYIYIFNHKTAEYVSRSCMRKYATQNEKFLKF